MTAAETSARLIFRSDADEQAEGDRPGRFVRRPAEQSGHLGLSPFGQPATEDRRRDFEEGDVFGGTVNFAARVVGAIKGAEIWLSERANGDIDESGAGNHMRLKWERHDLAPGKMKGFAGGFTLWS